MSNQTETRVPKWPFFVSDVLLVGAACAIYWPDKSLANPWHLLAFAVCGVLGAGSLILPAVLDYRALLRMGELEKLGSTAAQIQNLEELAAQISAATAQWQGVHEHSVKTSSAAREIADRMTAETQAFTEFLQKANDSERAHLRLEVEKLRRTESDWLLVIVRTLDHVYALNQAALRSGQTGLIEQLASFQNACRDAARRVGLVPFVAVPGDLFEAGRHQPAEGQPPAGPGAKVNETIATGYTFQGQLLRPAIVSLQAAAPAEAVESGNEVAGEVSDEPVLL